MTHTPGFTGSTLQRLDHERDDPDAIAARRADPAARLLRLDGLDPLPGADGGLDWVPLEQAPEGAPLALLGLMDGAPRFAALTPARGRPAMAIWKLLQEIPASEAATYATARSLVDWHARHGFCPNCAAATTIIRAGWARQCPNCGAEHFPRTDPVVIMLAEHVEAGVARVLIGRQPPWPAGRYSALAGFVEVGESIEEAVARELHEEAGVVARDVRYLASQPWPFPSSLMIAAIARVDDPTLRIDEKELEDAKWVGVDEVRAALADEPGAFGAPPPYAIAHTLFRRWLDAQESRS